VRAGISFSEALAGLHKSASYPIRGVVSDILARVNAGERLSEAMRASRGRFPVLMLRMIEVAEETGTLDEVLLRLADYYEWRLALRRRFFSSLAYPIMCIIVAIIVLAILSGVLAMVRGEPQPYNRATYVFLGGAGIIIALYLVYRILKATPFGKVLLDNISLRLPLIGSAMRQIHMSRLTLAMYLMSRTSIGVPEMLERGAETTNNQAFINKFRQAAERVRDGSRMTDALMAVDLLPAHFIQLMSVAEETGDMDETLRRLSIQYAEDAERASRRLSRVLTGLIYLVVGLFLIYNIFVIFRDIYLRNIQEALSGTGVFP